MQETLGVQPRIELDERGNLAESIACLRCEYDLRGLAPQAMCPECGFPIAQTLVGDRLQFASPEWVAKLNRGAGWIVMSMIVVILSRVIGVRIGVFGHYFVSQFVYIAGHAAMLHGTIQFTAPEPGKVDDEQISRTRRRARIAAFAIFTLSVPIILGLDTIGLLVQKVLSLAITIASGVLYLYLGRHTGEIARRCDLRKVAKQAVYLGYGLSIASAGLFVSALILIAIQSRDDTLSSAVWPVIAPLCAISFAYFVMLVWGFILLVILRSRLLKIVKQSRSTTWSPHPPA